MLETRECLRLSGASSMGGNLLEAVAVDVEGIQA
jgi:hypothetical protein